MNKSVFYVASFIMTALVLGSCDKEDGKLNADTPQEKVVYSYNLDLDVKYNKRPLTAQTRAFVVDIEKEKAYTVISDTDKIVLYNQTKNVFACDTLGNCIYLKPIIEKGLVEYFHLRQEIMFCRFENGEWQSIQVDPDDKYCIYYQINGVNTKNPSKSAFDFSGQTGKVSDYSNYDFYMSDYFGLSLDAGNKLSGNDIVGLGFLTSKVVLKFKYKWESGDTVTVPASVHDIMVLTSYETLVDCLYPFDGQIHTSPLFVDGLDEDGNLYLTTMFDYTNMDPAKHDKLFVDLYGFDAAGNEVYFWGVIEQPEAGFTSSNIYVREMELKEAQPNLS